MTSDLIREMATSPRVFRDALLLNSAHGERRFGEIVAPFQIERFAALDPALQAVANGDKPECGRFWWEATKGASKDTDLALCLMWLLCFTTRPLLCQIGAADQDQADELRLAAKGILRANEWLASRITIQSDSIKCDATGSVAEIIAADVAGSHGARPDVLILNELHAVVKLEFAQNLMDNAGKVPRGIVVIATNAGQLDTWQHQWRELARTSPRWSFHKFDQPAPWLDAAEIAEAERRNPRSRFLRLWGGVWVADMGDAAINDDDLTAALTIKAGPIKIPDYGRYSFLGGLDLAYRRDHSAFVVLASDHRYQRVRLAHCREWAPVAGQDIDLRDVKADIIEARDRLGVNVVFADESQAVLLGQLLAEEGVYLIPVPQSGKPAASRTMALIDAFKTRTVDLYEHPALIRDLKKLRAVERNNSVRLEATADEHGHADLGFAFSFALQSAVENCRKELVPNDAGFTIERVSA